MFNIGGGELLVILLIALIVLGPTRLPEAARQIGKVMGDLRKLSTGFQNEMRSALDTADDPTRTAARRNVLAKETPAAGVPAAVTEAVQSVSAVAEPDLAASPAHPTTKPTAPKKPAPAKKPGPAKKAATKKPAAKKAAKQASPAKKAAPAQKAATKKAAAKKAATKKASPAKKPAAKKPAAKKQAAGQRSDVPDGARRRTTS